MLFAVLRIRDVYPGSDFFPSGSRIRTKKLNILTPKNSFLSSRKYDPGWSSRIPGSWFFTRHRSRIQGSRWHWIPDPRVKKAPNPGSAATLVVCLCEGGGESTYLISMDMPWDSMVYLISAMMVRLAASIPRVQATYTMLMLFLCSMCRRIKHIWLKTFNGKRQKRTMSLVIKCIC